MGRVGDKVPGPRGRTPCTGTCGAEAGRTGESRATVKTVQRCKEFRVSPGALSYLLFLNLFFVVPTGETDPSRSRGRTWTPGTKNAPKRCSLGRCERPVKIAGQPFPSATSARFVPLRNGRLSAPPGNPSSLSMLFYRFAGRRGGSVVYAPSTRGLPV